MLLVYCHYYIGFVFVISLLLFGFRFPPQLLIFFTTSTLVYGYSSLNVFALLAHALVFYDICGVQFTISIRDCVFLIYIYTPCISHVKLKNLFIIFFSHLSNFCIFLQFFLAQFGIYYVDLIYLLIMRQLFYRVSSKPDLAIVSLVSNVLCAYMLF